MSWKMSFGIAAVFVAATLPGLSSAQTAKAAAGPGDTSQVDPSYDPTAAAIVTGLKGIVSGTKASLDTYRATTRMQKLHDGLTSAVFSGGNSISILNQDILCNVRETYAQVYADATYINTITSALDKAATPVKITTLGDALTSFFHRNSVSVKGSVAQAKPGATKDACISDLKAWAGDYYNHAFKQPIPGRATTATTTTVSGGIDGFLADAGAISGLANAVISIITPIATYIATKHQADQLNTSIDSFLGNPNDPNNIDNQPDGPKKADSQQQALMLTATDLAAGMTKLATKSRYQALGQYEEKLAALRQIKVDLTKLPAVNGKSCADIVKSPVSESEKFDVTTSAPTPAGNPTLHFTSVPSWISAEMPIYVEGVASEVPAGATVKSTTASTVTMSDNAGPGGLAKGTRVAFTFDTASEDFTSCVALAWRQVSSAASELVTAATAYDTIADVPDDQLTSAVKSIKADMAKALPWPASTTPASAQAAAQLLAFGQAMSTAFSSDNLQKLQSELDLVKKQFDVK